METRENLKIEDAGLINQKEWEYYDVTGKTPALIHFFLWPNRIACILS